MCVGFAEVSCSGEYSDLYGIDATYGRRKDSSPVFLEPEKGATTPKGAESIAVGATRAAEAATFLVE